MGKKKINPVLCDSNVLFNYLRGDEATRVAIDSIGHDRIAFSIITVAETLAGCNKENFTVFKNVFKRYPVYSLNNDISTVFNGLVQSNYSRHSKWIPDALIAATALANNLELFTYNRKDFDFIAGLKLYNR